MVQLQPRAHLVAQNKVREAPIGCCVGLGPPALPPVAQKPARPSTQLLQVSRLMCSHQHQQLTPMPGTVSKPSLDASAEGFCSIVQALQPGEVINDPG